VRFKTVFRTLTFTGLYWQVFLQLSFQARFVQAGTLAPINLGKFWKRDIRRYRGLAQLSWRKTFLNRTSARPLAPPSFVLFIFSELCFCLLDPSHSTVECVGQLSPGLHHLFQFLTLIAYDVTHSVDDSRPSLFSSCAGPEYDS
jgi:hypothetical protein